MILLSSPPPPWFLLPSPWDGIVNTGFLFFAAWGLAIWSISAMVYFAYQVRHGNVVPVTVGVLQTVLMAIGAMYAFIASALFAMMAIFAPIIFFSGESADWLVWGVVIALSAPGLCVLITIFRNMNQQDAEVELWVKSHFPPGPFIGIPN